MIPKVIFSTEPQNKPQCIATRNIDCRCRRIFMCIKSLLVSAFGHPECFWIIVMFFLVFRMTVPTVDLVRLKASAISWNVWLAHWKMMIEALYSPKRFLQVLILVEFTLMGKVKEKEKQDKNAFYSCGSFSIVLFLFFWILTFCRGVSFYF